MTDGPRTEPLRVAVLVDSLIVPAWVAWTIGRIDATPALELAAVLTAADARAVPEAARAPRDARHRIFRWYEWTDRTVFGSARAMRDADLSPITRGRTSPSAIRPLDAVVSFVPAARTVWDGPPPRHGVWAIVPMDDGVPTSAASRFWELRKGSGTATAAVVALDDGVPHVIAQGSARADPLSLTRTRNAAAWMCARLVLYCLRRVQRGGGLIPTQAGPARESKLPPPALTIRHAARTAARGVAAKSRTAWHRDEWFVAVRRRSTDGRTRGAVRTLPNPAGGYLADPFPVEVDGHHFIFVEDYSYAARRGAISVFEVTSDNELSPPRRVLECEHHLSYPFVFEHDGAVYMLPETGEAGRIELHRAVDFPNAWRLDRVLLDGLTALDATLHMEDGTFWLFANVVEGPEDGGQLWLFSSQSLDGVWRSHPRNPVVTDPGTARPAGRLFRRDDALVRPSQDCSGGYGRAVVLNRVDALSPSEYRETAVERIEPNWLRGIKGTHTYTFDSRYECLDGYRYVSRLRVRARTTRRAHGTGLR